jgi:hypothetical protein
VNQDLAYSLRLQSKRTDIPTDVVRTLSEAYQALQMTQNDQPEPVFRGASHMLHDELALHHGTVAMNDPKSLSEANQALQDVADAVSEMEAMLIEQRAEVKRLRDMEQMDQLLIKELLGKSEQLQKERDEARIWWLKGYYQDWKSEAKSRGWDCFKTKEETP